MRVAALAIVLCGGCPLQQRAKAPVVEDGPHLVAVEAHAGERAVLVIVGEDGRRVADVTPPAEEQTRDANPAFSPDGRWIAFASSRDRQLDGTSLWIVRDQAKGTPVRLTTGKPIDLTPAWTPDGKALVFASNRGGTLDLWKLALVFDGDTVRADGDPVRVTDLPGQEVSPSIAGDGRIAFTSIDAQGHSRISVRGTDGKVSAITSGPADSGPAWSPDGAEVAFTSAHPRSDGVDGDLYIVSAAGGTVTLVVDAPGTDEAGPQWSSDGRFLFASSIYRALDHARTPLFSAIVYVDREEKTPLLRILDPGGTVPRLGIAVAPRALDAATLDAGASYQDAMRRILKEACGDECAGH